MELTKKVSVLGSKPGGNRAEVIEEDREVESERARYSMDLVQRAGEVFKPVGADYLGTAVIHYYSLEHLATNPQFFVACQTALKNVAEHHADLGWKQLQSALMKVYGRKEPKTRS